MDGFERYKEAKKQQEQRIEENQALNNFYAQKTNKGLELPNEDQTASIFDYDATQLAQKFEDRNKGGAEDFKLRTEYYFTDTRLAEAKANKYNRLASNPRERIKPFSRVYSNRWTNKRQKNAAKASAEFLRMRNLMEQLKANDASMNSFDKYFARKDIMEARISAMSHAAVTKSKSSKHEDYLKNRAKLSCYMILKDQLEHLIEEENSKLVIDHLMVDNLNYQLELLQADIDSAQQKVSRYAPSVSEEWRNKNNFNDNYYRNKMNEYKEHGPCDMVKAKLTADLSKIAWENSEETWPHQVVLTDAHGAPISKGEIEKKQWNQKYDNAEQLAKSNDPVAKETLKDLELKAIERFDKLPVPTPGELTKENLAKYITEHLGDYYNLFKGGLKYYTSEDLPAHIKEYKRSHPEFVAKLTYLTYVDKTIDGLLRQDYGIQFSWSREGEPKYQFESDDRYRYQKDSRGRWVRNDQFRSEQFTQVGAMGEYARYNKVKKAIEIRKNNDKKRVKPLITIAGFDQKDASSATLTPPLTNEQKTDYAELKMQSPDFTESDYYFSLIVQDAYNLNKSEYLKKAVARGKGIDTIRQHSGILDGAHSFFLQNCNFTETKIKDEKNLTKKIEVKGVTPKDEEIVKNNQTCIRLWTRNTDADKAARRKYIRENLPKFAENFKFPSKEELESGAFMKKERLIEILDYTRRAKAFDDLMKQEKAVVTEVCKKNDAIEVRVNALNKLGDYVEAYLSTKHLIKVNSSGPSIYTQKKADKNDTVTINRLSNNLDLYTEYLGSMTDHLVDKEYLPNTDEYDYIKRYRNDLLSPEAYKVYKTNNMIRDIYENPNLKELYSFEITRTPASLLRKVHYTPEYKPVSDQDYLNDKWNADVLLAFENEDHARITELAKKELLGLYKDIKLPAPPQNANFEWVKDWVENEFIQNSEKWLDIFRRQSAIGDLTDSYPEVGEALNEDAEFQIMKKQCNQLKDIAFSYMEMTYYLDLTQEDRLQIQTYDAQNTYVNPTREENIELAEHKKELEKDRADKEKETRPLIDQYLKEYSESFNVMKSDFPDNNHVDEESLSAKEFKKFQKVDPKFTEKGYEIYKSNKMLYYGQRYDPKIQAAYDSIAKDFGGEEELAGDKKKMKSSGSADRDVAVYFRMVNYDDTYEPATEEDEENLRHNLDALEAIKEGDLNKLDDAITEFIPKAWENIELPPVPSDDEFDVLQKEGIFSKNKAVVAYKEKLDKYIDNIIENGGYRTLQFLETKTLSMNRAMDNNDALQLYMLDNPDFDVFTSAVSMVNQTVEAMSIYKHHADKSKGNLPNIDPNKSIDDQVYKAYQSKYFGGVFNLIQSLHSLGSSKFPKDKIRDYKRNSDLTEADKERVKQYRATKKK